MDPYKELTSIIDKHIQKRVHAAAFWAPSILGTITESGGLKLDYFNLEIKEYLVADWVLDGEIEGTLEMPQHTKTGQITLPSIPTSSGGPTVAGPYSVTYQFDDWTYSGSEDQKISVSKLKLHLKPQLTAGDRVLVAPINNGRDFVVISKVVPK